jgi:hypothetical protein
LIHSIDVNDIDREATDAFLTFQECEELKLRPVFILAAGVALLAAGAGTAFAIDAPPATTQAVTAQAAAPYANTFERPPAGAPYLRDAWAADGWNAPWEQGLAARSRIDDTVAHSGGKSLRAFYPKGVISPENSGLSAPFSLAPSREYHFSQWVRFSPDFSWGTTSFAGKIGVGLAGGGSCSGGKVCDGYNGFSSRMIWRPDGRASLYYYHMGHAGTYGDDAPFSLDGAAVHFPRGQWVNLAQRVKVNTVTDGQANPDGEIEAWYNGRRVVYVTGLRFVRNGDLVDRAYFSSFFGGATAEFAPKNDSWIWYDDFKASPVRGDICEISGGCPGNPTPPVTKPPVPTPTATPPAPPTATTPPPVPGVAAWQPNTAYLIGQTVTHSGAIYRCRQAHRSLPGWEPVSTAALWLRL